MTQAAHFADRLTQAVLAKKSPLCVGIDPRWDSLPEALRKGTSLADQARAYSTWSCALIDAIAPVVPVVKPQVAFFEALGHEGMRAYEEVVSHARAKGLLVIADVKRGDISTTAEAYARAWLMEGAGTPWAEGRGPDAITASPYLGGDSVEPLVLAASRAGKGVFVLVKTSNAGSGDLQDVMVDGRAMYMHVASRVVTWGRAHVGSEGYSLVGAVVGATHVVAATKLREAMPQAILLLPGLGAQGAKAADVKACFHEGMKGAIVSASRSVIFAYAQEPYRGHFGEKRWERACEEAAKDLAAQVAAAL